MKKSKVNNPCFLLYRGAGKHPNIKQCVRGEGEQMQLHRAGFLVINDVENKAH